MKFNKCQKKNSKKISKKIWNKKKIWKKKLKKKIEIKTKFEINETQRISPKFEKKIQKKI